jgi:hypothetical protein
MNTPDEKFDQWFKNGDVHESLMRAKGLAEMAESQRSASLPFSPSSSSSPKPYTRSSNFLPIDYTFLGTTVPYCSVVDGRDQMSAFVTILRPISPFDGQSHFSATHHHCNGLGKNHCN